MASALRFASTSARAVPESEASARTFWSSMLASTSVSPSEDEATALNAATTVARPRRKKSRTPVTVTFATRVAITVFATVIVALEETDATISTR